MLSAVKRYPRALSLGLVGAVAIAALSFGPAWAAEAPPVTGPALLNSQSFTVSAGAAVPDLDRGSYSVVVIEKPKPVPAPEPEQKQQAPRSYPQAPSDPTGAQAIAAEQVAGRGWGEAEFGCLVALWNKESGWNAGALNRGSGAYGIPQALPGSKMASAGVDWETNPATQIAWGLGYIGSRYGSPCGAWDYSQNVGWY